ncbi:9689_t:CDS:2 [Dentiscutata erythropus]|uniref:9689_t:CDS:1 n=1 Tax=Dentiscutata erythropus TaxID=1348616 RepID=A0A9N9CCI6_9GLOM|nr:9689_t:CDS:2 [Dentiscutata erythropus]
MGYSFDKIFVLTIIFWFIGTISIIYTNEVENSHVDIRNLYKRAYSTVVTTYITSTPFVAIGVTDSCEAIYPTNTSIPQPIYTPPAPVTIPPKTPQPIVPEEPTTTQAPKAPVPAPAQATPKALAPTTILNNTDNSPNLIVSPAVFARQIHIKTGSTTSAITPSSTPSSASSSLLDKLTGFNFIIELISLAFIINQII